MCGMNETDGMIWRGLSVFRQSGMRELNLLVISFSLVFFLLGLPLLAIWLCGHSNWLIGLLSSSFSAGGWPTSYYLFLFCFLFCP